jgi:hypothetical protein
MSEPCEHKVDDRDSYIDAEGPIYWCSCGKSFTVEELINERARLRRAISMASKNIRQFAIQGMLRDATLGLLETALRTDE